MDHVIEPVTIIYWSLFASVYCFILFRTCVSMFRSWISIVMGADRYTVEIQGLFDHLMKLPLAYFEKRKGDILARWTPFAPRLPPVSFQHH